MRDQLARTVLFALGVLGIGAGVAGILGLSRLETRSSAILVGVGVILNGWAVVRMSRGSNNRVGGPTA
jgi:hypothetical protein